NNDNIQQALIAEEIVNQEDQRAIEVLLQTNINESLKVNIDQYLEVVDLTVLTE
ncbi:15767_t:CDS:1, partial [Funneliformis geosporum]